MNQNPTNPDEDDVLLDCILPAEPHKDEYPHDPTGKDHAQAVNSYREAAKNFLPFLDQVLAFVINYENPRLAAFVIAIATGRTALTNGISQKELADRVGLTRAAVSKCTKSVQARFGNSISGIEPMPGQRSMSSCRKLSEVRNNQLTQNEKHT